MILFYLYDYMRIQPKSRIFMLLGLILLGTLLYLPIPIIAEPYLTPVFLAWALGGLGCAFFGIFRLFYEWHTIPKSDSLLP